MQYGLLQVLELRDHVVVQGFLVEGSGVRTAANSIFQHAITTHVERTVAVRCLVACPAFGLTLKRAGSCRSESDVEGEVGRVSNLIW